MTDYKKGRLVRPSRRKVKDALAECLARIEHPIKPSMVQNWRNYTAGRNARIDWKALSPRIGHSDVALTMRQYVQTDLDVHRQVATALAELILGGVMPVAEFPAVRGNSPDAPA
jgi:hypothetical protein